jgi:hypothetical protein
MLATQAVLLLAFTSVNIQIGIIPNAMVLALSIVTIVSFAQLGKRSFYFFNPAVLSSELYVEIVRRFNSVTSGGRYWLSSWVQAKRQRQADASLNTLANLLNVSLTDETKSSSTALAALGQQCLRLLSQYTRIKAKIPRDSMWFVRVYKHQDWLTAEASSVEIALRTGTSLVPTEVPDSTWLEMRVAELLSICGERMAKASDLRLAFNVVDYARATVGEMAKNWAFDEAVIVLDALRVLPRGIARRDDIPRSLADSRKEQHVLQALAVVQATVRSYTAVFLGAREAIIGVSPRTLSHFVKNTDFANARSVYRGGVPEEVTIVLASVKKGISLESSIENQQVSPQWYINQLVAMAYLRSFRRLASIALSRLESALGSEVTELVSGKRYLFAAQLIEDGLEAVNKAYLLGEALLAASDDLAGCRRIQDMPWVNVDLVEYKKRVEAVRLTLMTAVVQVIIPLSLLPRSKKNTTYDYFGHAYALLSDEAFVSLRTHDVARFSFIFPILFLAALKAVNRLSIDLAGQTVDTQVAFVPQPLIDLVALSGHALIYSELDQTGEWRVVKDCWDKHLATMDSGVDLIRMIVTAVQHDQTHFTSGASASRRFTWEREQKEEFVRRGLVSATLGLFRRPTNVDHPSAVIRIVAEHEAEDPEAVFIAFYLWALPSLPSVKLGWRTQRLVEQFRALPNQARPEEGQ